MWRHFFLSIRAVHQNSRPSHTGGWYCSPAHCQPFTMSESKRRKLNGPSHILKRSRPDSTPRDRESTPPAPDIESESQDASDSEASITVTKSFQELGIIDSLCDACTSLGYKQPTPIQREAIPLALQGKDVGHLGYIFSPQWRFHERQYPRHILSCEYCPIPEVLISN